MQPSGCGVIRRSHLIAVVVTFLMGCAILLVVGVSGVQATATEEQGTSDDRCEGTRFVFRLGGNYTTNDVPGCPSGGLLSGSDVDDDFLAGVDGDDEIRGFGGNDSIFGGAGNDVIYGGPGADEIQSGKDDDVLYGGDGAEGTGMSGGVYGGAGDDVIYSGDGNDRFIDGGAGEDVIYGGDGNDILYGATAAHGEGQDKLYCGEGKDRYYAEKIDYVDSSCEKGKLVDTGGPPLILLAGAALLLGSGILTYAILRRRWSLRTSENAG